jgi:branched-chain amino acid transport system substrate-binding protein
VNLWGNDENLVRLAGKAAEGVLGLQAAALYGDDVPGMKAILEVTHGERKVSHYVRGWASMMVLCEGLRRAELRGELGGPSIRRELENLRDFDTQGLTAPITYTPKDHRPNLEVRIYEFSGGRMRRRALMTGDR